MQRRKAVVVLQIDDDDGADFEQTNDHALGPVHRRAVQRRPAASVQQAVVRLVVEEQLHTVQVRVARCYVQRRVLVVVLQIHNKAVGVALLCSPKEELRGAELAIRHRNLERRFTKVRVRVELGPAVQAQVDQLRVVRAARPEQRRVRDVRRRIHQIDRTAVVEQLLRDVQGA